MNKLEKEIRRLREELDRKREELADIRKLFGGEIDREFSAPVEGYSDRELEIHLQEVLASMDALAEARPDLRAVSSHRKTIGRPIVFLKRVLLETTFAQFNIFLEGQLKFNRRILDLLRALHVRDVRGQARFKALEAGIAGCEEDLALLRAKLEDFRAAVEPEPRGSGHPGR
jgi:hypothetical protein